MPRSPARRAEDLPEYGTLLATARQLLDQGRKEAYQRIDQIRARTYVAIGAEILSAELRQQRGDYGRQMIAGQGRNIGFSESNVYSMVAVARAFSADSLPMPMSWPHLVRLSGMVSSDARQFYERATSGALYSGRAGAAHFRGTLPGAAARRAGDRRVSAE